MLGKVFTYHCISGIDRGGADADHAEPKKSGPGWLSETPRAATGNLACGS